MILLYIVLGIFLVMNFVTFCLYAADKNKAKRGKWRISERALLLCSFFGGGLGGFIAMYTLRHKTKREHWYFTFVNILGILVQIAAVTPVVIYRPF